ncbi:MAG: hypothetical protein CMG75_10220 [Candidatus Marinimicrobia bacterium]|nr:hypothetical protein [Candidatus Neomarinimicrobiota bacterium]|tara:strand:+ start:10281 stop:13583 length:3303 start_codon:yes stop_codon:yes gene_type:complete
MKKSIFIIFGLFSFLCSQVKLPQFQNNSIRVYFDESIDINEVNKSKSKSGIKDVDDFLHTFGDFKITQWLPKASEKDKVDDVLLNRFYDIKFEKDSFDLEIIKNGLEAKSSIKVAEYIPRHIFEYKPNDPFLRNQWHLKNIKAEEAWSLWNTGSGEVPGDCTIVVSIVDSGCQWDHPDLVDNLWNNLKEDADGDGHTIELINGKWELDPGDLNDIDDDGNGYIDDLIGWDISGTTSGNDPDNNPMAPPEPGSTNGNVHGTHVAGIVAASTDNGLGISSIGFSIKHMPVKVQYDENPSDSTFEGGGSQGVLYSAKAGANIINLSWGSGGRSSSEQALYKNIRENYGSIVVAAAGNSNSDEFHYPSAYSSVIAVASSNSNDKKSGFSNYGKWVDIIAPGSGILSTVYNENYESWSGTSMASPLVAGALGLIWSYYPNESAERIEQMLFKGADDIYEKNQNYNGELGSGRLNVFRSIASGTLPQLKVASYSVQAEDDDDEILNPGEVGFLRVVLENEDDWADASDIYAKISTDHWAVTLLDSEAVFPNIKSGNSGVNVVDRFKFQIDENMIPEQIPFYMTISASGSGTAKYFETINFFVKVTLDQIGFPVSFEKPIRTSPTIIDIDGDKEKELIFGSDDKNLYVLDSRGKIKWIFEAGRNIRSTPAFGDVDGNDSIDLVFGSMDNFLYILDNKGSIITSYESDGMIISSPSLSDLDYDGDLEIIFPIFEKKLYVIHHDGTDFGNFPIPLEGSLFSGTAIGDIDRDGGLDIVLGTWENKIYVFTVDGAIPSGFPFETGGKISTDPALADLTGDGKLEIIFGSDDENLYIIDWKGKLISNYYVGDKIQSSPIIDDLDNNGELEIIFGANNGNLYAVNFREGALIDLSGWPIALGSTPIKGSPVSFDLNNNGIAEVIASASEGLLFAVEFDGSIAPNFPVNNFGSNELSFSVDDIDGDGDAEIATVSSTKLALIDVKTQYGLGQYWFMYRGGYYRTGMMDKMMLPIGKEIINIPEDFSVSNNFPNPFNPRTSFRISLPSSEYVNINIYDLTGKLISTLYEKEMVGGVHLLDWNGKLATGNIAPAGVYLLSVKAGKNHSVRKITLLK